MLRPASILPYGIVCSSWNEVHDRHPEWTAQVTLPPDTDRSKVLVTHVATRHNAPLFWQHTGTTDTSAYIEHYILLESGSKAVMVIQDVTLPSGLATIQEHTHIVLAPQSDLTFIREQQAGTNAKVHTTLQAELQTGSTLCCMHFSLSSMHIRNEYSIDLSAPEARCTLYGLAALYRVEQLDQCVLIRHTAPSCHSFQSFKHILQDQSEASFSGRILVPQDAQKTEAYQQSHNILLSSSAVMHVEPQLEIYADDVKCSHGATVGLLDQDALFYLRQRGLSQEQAYQMLLKAFMTDMLQKLPDDELYDYFMNLLDKKLKIMIP